MIYIPAIIPAKHQIALIISITVCVQYRLIHGFHITEFWRAEFPVQFIQNPCYCSCRYQFSRYNTVTDYLFLPFLKKIRHAAGDSSRSADLEELEKFDRWGQANPKFMNFAKRSLIPGECVIQAVLSPEIRQNIIKIFGKTYDIVVSPTLAAILTDQELIMIREEKNHLHLPYASSDRIRRPLLLLGLEVFERPNFW